MSCTGWKYTASPGMNATARDNRAITTWAWSRSFSGRSAMVSRPVFGVALIMPAPTKDTTPVTAGSRATIAAARACSADRRGIDALCPASVTATSTPVSCCGRNPLGTAMYSQTVPTSVATPVSSISD